MPETPLTPNVLEASSEGQLPTSLVGRVVGGKWQLETCIGTGSFGEVWIAKHKVTLGQKAIKLLHPAFSAVPELVDRFVREAQAAAAIDSPHVVNVDDIGHDTGIARVYLVMEHLRGESLYQYLVRPPYRMPPGDAIVVLRQIAAALDAAHRVGIVHRDLKPENVFLSWRSDGTVMAKVLDFGIAKLTEPMPDNSPFVDGPSIRRARTVAFIGTPGYASPEQVHDSGTVTTAADVFALGVCTFEMLTGTTYWRSRTAESLFVEIALGVTESPSVRATGTVLTPAFDAWFLKCCALDPSERFPSAGEAVSALEDALGQCDSLPAPPPRADVPQIIQTTGRRRVSGKMERVARVSDPVPAVEINMADLAVSAPAPAPAPAAPPVPQAETLDMPPRAVSTEILAPRTHAPSRNTAFALVAGVVFVALALVAVIRPSPENAPHAATASIAPASSSAMPTAAPIATPPVAPAPVATPPVAPAVTQPAEPAPVPTVRVTRGAGRVAAPGTVRTAPARPRTRPRWLNYVAPGL